MHIKLTLIVLFSVARFCPVLHCPVKEMLEQILAQPLFDSHRELESDYYIFENDLSEGFGSVQFGTKTLKLTDCLEGNVFIIESVKYDSSKVKANVKILLEGDNLLIDAWFLRLGKRWKLEKLTFIET